MKTPSLQFEQQDSRATDRPVKDWRLTPVSSAHILNWRQGPRFRAALVWNRPRWLVLSHQGETYRVAVPDVTRRLQLAAIALGLGLAWLLMRKRIHS